MNKRIIFYLIIIITIACGSFYFYQTSKTGEKNKEKHSISTEKENLFIFENKDKELSAEIEQRFKKQFARAVEEIKNNKNNTLAWAVAGNLKKAVNDFQGAEKLYLKGLENIPDDFVLHNNLADLYYHFLNNYEKAEQYYLKTIELKPDYLQSYLELAILYRVKFKDKEKAINIIKSGLEKNPKNKELMVGLANLYRKFNMTKEAKDVWQELIELYPDNELYKKELETLQ